MNERDETRAQPMYTVYTETKPAFLARSTSMYVPHRFGTIVHVGDILYKCLMVSYVSSDDATACVSVFIAVFFQRSLSLYLSHENQIQMINALNGYPAHTHTQPSKQPKKKRTN